MRRHHIIAELQAPDTTFIRQLLPTSTRCVLRFNAASTANLTIRDTHPAVQQLQQDGVRAAVWMVTVDGNNLTTRRLLEGPVGDLSGDGPNGTVTIPVIDDFVWFSQILGWPNPTAAIATQTSEVIRHTGPSDVRSLNAIRVQATRLGLPWNVATGAGVGSSGSTELRMHPVADRILPALTADRLRLTIERNGPTWDVDVREGPEYPRPLTAQSGVLAAWQWKRQRPQLTRVVVGGDGQKNERRFATVVNSALEAQLSRIMEGFDDSRMADAGASLTPYGLDALAAAAGKSGVTATLRETSWFRFPDAYDLGTRVTIQAGAFTASDVITEIEITHAANSGFNVTPKVGFTVTDPQEKLTQFVAALAASVRTFERS